MATIEEPQSTICEADLCVEAAGCQYGSIAYSPVKSRGGEKRTKRTRTAVEKLKACNAGAWGTCLYKIDVSVEKRGSDSSYREGAYRDWRSDDNQIAANDRVRGGGRCISNWYCLYSPQEMVNSAEQQSREDASWELHWGAYQSRGKVGILRFRACTAYICVLGVQTVVYRCYIWKDLTIACL